MNKQEAVEKIKAMIFFDKSYDELKLEIIRIISQIHEPQKVVVPKFVAEWIEKCKDLNCSLRDAMKNTKLSAELNVWFLKTGQDMFTYPNQEIFARAWLDGHEIEQEKLYTVEIPNPNSAGGKTVLFKQQSTGRLILDMLNPNINKPKYLHLTESEIKQDFEWAWQFAKEVE